MQQKVRAAERDLEMEHQRTTPEELSKNAADVEELQLAGRFQASRVKSLTVTQIILCCFRM